MNQTIREYVEKYPNIFAYDMKFGSNLIIIINNDEFDKKFYCIDFYRDCYENGISYLSSFSRDHLPLQLFQRIIKKVDKDKGKTYYYLKVMLSEYSLMSDIQKVRTKKIERVFRDE